MPFCLDIGDLGVHHEISLFTRTSPKAITRQHTDLDRRIASSLSSGL
jgi:hypothetical protein